MRRPHTIPLRSLRAFVAVFFLVTALFVMSDPAPAASVVPVTDVDQGYDHSCALASGGVAYCWGRNNYGQLGDGTNDDRPAPVLVNGSLSLASIDGGDQFTCGVTLSGVGYCWGRNNSGQLGNGSTSDSTAPVAVAGGHTWTSISAGDQFACGVNTSNDAYCWGKGTQGQLGDSTNAASTTSPSLVSGSHQWAAVLASGNAGQHACGITAAGAAYCWGLNGNGQLGTNNTTATNSPVLVNGGLTWAQISAGGASTCGVTTSGAGRCWGSNYTGQNGDGTTNDSLVPTTVSGGGTWSRIEAGGGATCAIRTSGVPYCWGANGLGAIGDGTNNTSHSPVAVAGSYTFTTISIGGGGSCGRTSSSAVYCWGWNAYGQVGNGLTANTNAPSGVLTLTNLAENTTLSVFVNPSFNFSVAGYNSGACNGATINATASTSTAIPLRPTTGVNAIGGQTLTVASNAGGGYTVFARSTGPLTAGGGFTIPDWTGSNAVPTAFAAAGNAHMGYTTDHALGGSTRFQTDKWSGFTTGNEVVATATSVTTADVTHLCVQAGIAPSTAAGVYNAIVIYTAVPTY